MEKKAQTQNKLWIRFIYIYSLLFVLLSIISSQTKAEGTKQIMPYDTCLSRINLEPTFTNFAMYNCSPDARLNIHIENIGEKIYWGFGKVLNSSQISAFDVVYRIKDPNGNVVFGPSPMPLTTATSGFISSFTKAHAGPTVINNLGYQALLYTPTTTGDYYIEFDFPYNLGSYDRREIEYFDITVTNNSNQKIDGRVWSKEWQFTVTASSYPTAYENPFYGEMYIYSDDSIVTSVDFNGIKPLVFAMSANATGTANTGNTINDRKSVSGKSTYPQYKIFLNNPDSLVYPSGLLGYFTAPLVFRGCPGNHCIDVSVSKAGAIRLLIDLNGVPGYQIGTSDIQIVQNISVGTTCIPWSGLDGLGNPVANGTVVKFNATFVSGLTHLPIYDAESNPNGYKIALVRPQNATTTFNLFWDDSNFPGSTTPPSTGCTNPLGCHSFGNMFGNMRTINTWWYAASNISDSLSIIYSRIRIDSNTLTNPSCPNTNNGSIIVYASGGTLPYSYSLNGSATQNSSVFNNLPINTYIIDVTDSNNCSTSDTVQLTSSPMLLATTSTIADTCNVGYGVVSVIINTGSPPYQYQWNTTPASSNPIITNLNAGQYTVTITDFYNCSFTFNDSVINISSNIQVNATILDDTCGNNMGSISISTINGNSPITYNWNTNPPQTTSSIQNLGLGNYSLTVTENGSCISYFNYNIANMPPPSSLFSLPDTACYGDSIQLIYIGNQTSPDNFSWNLNAANQLTGVGLGPLTISYQQTGKHFISLNVSKAGCPSSSNTDSIEIFHLQASIDSISDAKCFGNTNGYLSINSHGGVLPYSYFWNPGGIGGVMKNNLSAGQYSIYVTDLIGCKAKVSAIINQPNKLILNYQINEVSCSYLCDGSITANVNGGISPYLYSWNSATANSKSSFLNACPNAYKLVVSDSNQCKDSAIIKLGFQTKILADFDVNYATEYEKRNTAFFDFTGFGAQTYNWDFGDFSHSVVQNPSHYYENDTTYWVELIVNSGTPNNCTDTALKLITVLPPFNVFVPNVFTPDGDGLNDYFKIVGLRIKEYHLYIYNRWGKLIFISNSTANQWNGYCNSEKLPQGVYTYLIKVVDENDKKYSRAGTVLLMR